MRMNLLAVVLLCAGLGCTKERACREGTVSLTVSFADGPERVDSVAMRCRLDDEPFVDLQPLQRPPGASQGTMALDVKNYASRKQVLVQYAPRKGEQLAGSWQERLIRLAPGCTAVELSVATGIDGGPMDAATSVEQSMRVDATSAAEAPARRPDGGGDLDAQEAEPQDAGSITRDAPSDPTSSSEADVQVDVPLAPVSDGPADPVASVDAPNDQALAPVSDGPADPVASVDAPNDQALAPGLDGPRAAVDAVGDGQLDASLEAGDTQPLGCLIDSTPYAPDETNPNNKCEICQPESFASSWTRKANGTPCASGQVCDDGLCRPGCWIDGAFRGSGTSDSGNTCRYCNPTVSTKDWSVEEDGTTCGNNQGCQGGKCGSGCWIGGTFYPSGTARPGSPCHSCQPGTSAEGWTAAAEGTPCNTSQVCSSGTCGDCVIGNSRCSSENVQQVCQSNQTWKDTTCAYGCNASSRLCNSTCKPGTTQCSPSGRPQQCDGTGSAWSDLTACAAGTQCTGAGICPKSDGQSCNVAGDCASGNCTLFYQDQDADGYHGTATRFCGLATPTGWTATTQGSDCCDSDANAFPGQSSYFTSPRVTCGGYDYDCDGVEKKYWTGLFPGSGGCADPANQECGSNGCSVGCVTLHGWIGASELACGETGTYSECKLSHPGGASPTEYNCGGATCSDATGAYLCVKDVLSSSRVQRCR